MHDFTQQEFARLLTALDADHNRAAEKYELLRRKLIKMFERRQCVNSEELADETLDRLMRKMETEQIHDVNLFACGVARKIYHEGQKRVNRLVEINADHQSDRLSASYPDPEQSLLLDWRNDRGLACLTACLRRLREEDSRLIMEYYQEEKQERVQKRKALALRRGISIEVLRVEATRLRYKLRSCVSPCLNRRLQGGSRGLDATLKAVKGARGGK